MFRRVGRCIGIPFTLATFSRPPVLAQDSSHAKPRSFWYKKRVEPTPRIFGYHEDTYGGVIFDFESTYYGSTDVFKTKLRDSLSQIRSDGYTRGVWLKIPKSHVSLIPICVEDFAFDFHHAETDYVMLCKWLHPTKPNSLPGPATHTVGVGAVCVTADNKILLVREQSGPAAMLKVWKLPTGKIEPGEDLPEAVLREVKEETGLTGEFEGVVFVRHNLKGAPYLGDKADLFFVCLVKIADPAELQLQADEIAAAEWVPADELGNRAVSAGLKPGSSALATMEAAAHATLQAGIFKPKKFASWRNGEFLTHYSN